MTSLATKNAADIVTGIQGVVKATTINGLQVIEKRSKRVDYTIELEGKIGMVLNELNSDHFCRYYEFVKEDEGFEWSVTRPKLLMEKVNGILFGKLVMPPEDGLSLVARTLAIMAVVNEELGICHNDLHMNNIMIKKSEFDVQAYLFPDGEEMVAYTYGKSPIVIDFGMAYSGPTSSRMLMTVENSSIGYFPHELDRIADARRLVYAANWFKYVPDKIKKQFEVKELDEKAGYFKPGAFPDFLSKLFDRLTSVTVTDEIMALFVAHVPLPLQKSPDFIDLDTAFRLFKFSIGKQYFTAVNIKLLVHNDFKNLSDRIIITLDKFLSLREACYVICMGISNILYDYAAAASEKKRKLYATMPVSRVRDVAKQLMPKKVIYTPEMNVSVYDVKTRRVASGYFNQEICAGLNSNLLKLADVISAAYVSRI